MIYNEYAQVLETENPETGELYQPDDMVVIDYNEVGTAMLQDAVHARASWLAEEGNEDIATRFLAGVFKGWAYCRDNPDECVQFTVDAGSTLGLGHQRWMMNEINALIWPSPGRHRRDADGDVGHDGRDHARRRPHQRAARRRRLAQRPDRSRLGAPARQGVDLNGEGFTKADRRGRPRRRVTASPTRRQPPGS